jgi:hypothetical protein
MLPAPNPAPLNPVNTKQTSSPSITIVVTDHMKWAQMIARGVRQAFHFKMGSQEEQDLEATAYLALVELMERFDPSKIPSGVDPNHSFRGWAVLEVRCRCLREAYRLRNGGTYHTRREKAQKRVVVERLINGPDMVDPRSLVDDDEEEDESNS